MIRLKNQVTVFSILISNLLMIGCMTEPDLSNYPAVSFNNEVKLIISSNCNQPGCHGPIDREEISLETYEEIVAQVEPGNGRKSKLYRMITGREKDIMPASPLSLLSDEQIRTIFVWIEQGAPNN